jgi:hypothetical protein
MTFFGQFFDHGLDLVEKGGSLAIGVADERDRRLRAQPRQLGRKPLRPEQRTARRARRNSPEGARRKWAETVLERDQAGRREETPFVEIAPRDLALREGPRDFGAVLARLLGFTLTGTGGFG